MEKIKEWLCAIKGTVYLVGGYEFGHQWRRLEGETFIFCRKCFKKKSIATYRADSTEGLEYRDLLHKNTNL